jgi:hypothetical protein
MDTSARIIFNFAEAYSLIAQEQHGVHTFPERLPTEREVIDMLSNVELIKRSLAQVRDLVQTSIQNERAQEGATEGYYDEHDVPMYGDAMKPQYGITEVKKRRGVSMGPFQRKAKANIESSVQVLLADATAATELTPQSGDADLMVLERSAMPVVFTTPSWRESDN